ncbi:MAG: metalloregulator ArsR/SmtB family transcription factor [Candidatus Shapirobacteria bacterium]|jgi:DNA-binding transcriptional ArsR family regulator|nr:metalloregulator ArsR/SmtB family transcription factor [Candidatus Shapirobacteria bacterium]
MDKIFKALADKNRRKILTLLKDKNLSVNELLTNFEIGQATLSNHLSILKKANLVKNEIKGKQRIYRLNKDLLFAFAENMRRFVGKIDNTLVDVIAIRGQKV